QAEDGIRDFHVTGVQTCALPISSSLSDLVRRYQDQVPVSRRRPRPKSGPVSNNVQHHTSRMQGSQLNLGPCNLGFKVSVLFEDAKHPGTVKFFQNINLALGTAESEVEPPTAVQLQGTAAEGALPSLRGAVAKLPVPTTVLAEDADIAKKLGELRGRYPDALGEVGHLNRVTGEPAVVDGHLRASLFQLSGLVLD